MISTTISNDTTIQFDNMSGYVETKLGNKLIMEDYHMIYKVDDDFYIFGIFDGHGGYYISKQLPSLFKKYITTPFHLSISSLLEICYLIDHDLYKLWYNNNNGGSTVLLVIYTTLKTIILHIGDTKAKCYNHNNMLLYETIDHNISNIDELDRIRSIDNNIITYINKIRINNQLSVTRSIGNYKYKIINNKYDGKYSVINCVPEIKIIDTSELRCIIMGSDGFWNISNSCKLDDIISNPEKQVQYELHTWIQEESANDNITLIGLYFNS